MYAWRIKKIQKENKWLRDKHQILFSCQRRWFKNGNGDLKMGEGK